jgi:hypothetical protein
MASDPRLLPVPRHLEWAPGSAPSEVPIETQRVGELAPEHFEIEITPGTVRIRHGDEGGLRYARDVLELLRESDGSLRCARISDGPDLRVRGYMLDVSRDRVPTRATLARIVEVMRVCRLNQLQLYTEHTFAYVAHEAVWRDASPITPDDVRWLDALCRENGIELVANQNGFGHMGRWLRHEPYRRRAEAPDGWRSPLGALLPPATLAPTEDNARFVVELVQELVRCFSSKRVNIGFDEPFELGMGAARAAVEARGKARVYLEQLLRVVGSLHEDGLEVLFWGDILRPHPELVRELPDKDVVALAWHYEAPTDPETIPAEILDTLGRFGIEQEAFAGFEAHVASYARGGLPFWVCPGTSGWNSFVGRHENMLANVCDALETGRRRGASGFLLTDWGDNGHLQPPSVSFPAMLYAGAAAWSLDRHRDIDVAAALDRHVFRDPTGRLGAALVEAGGAYRATGRRGINGSPLFSAVVGSGMAGAFGEVDVASTQNVADSLESAMAEVGAARPGCADGALVCRELSQAMRLARQGAWRMLRDAGAHAPDARALRRDLAEAIEEQRACWLARSRPGGLQDSLARLEKSS